MWVSISSFNTYDEFIEFCKAVHSDEEDPELMYKDYQNFPHCWYCESGLHDTFDKILEYAKCENQEAAEIYINDLGHDDVDGFEDAYMGEWKSEEDFAWHIYEECYEHEMSEFANKYFNIESFARDLFDDSFYYSAGHVFSRD